jgi:hypothetical protein
VEVVNNSYQPKFHNLLWHGQGKRKIVAGQKALSLNPSETFKLIHESHENFVPLCSIKKEKEEKQRRWQQSALCERRMGTVIL